MDSNLHHHQNQQPQHIMNSGLTRYRSAPSSYFSNLINNGIYGDEDSDPFFNPRVSSPETEQILSRFMSSVGDNTTSHQNLGQIGENEVEYLDSMKQEQRIYSNQTQQEMMYGKLAGSQKPGHDVDPVVMDDPLMAMNPPSNLLRQSSSPAGFFAHVDMDKVMTSMDDFGGISGSLPNSSFSSSKRLKTQMGFSSPSSSRPLSRIPENEGKTSVHGSSWDESTILSASFPKELGESDQNTFSSLDSLKNQNEERIHAPTMLTHRLSLPTSSTELSAMENIIQFQDSVPLMSRAKRGCATHPRSIAERVRRTRISERMRKLQELVPNMDKQTNTADMLDLAVDYIKQLQKQVETLSDRHAKCTCPHKQKL